MAEGDEQTGAEGLGQFGSEAEDAQVLAGGVPRGEGEGDLEADGGVPEFADRVHNYRGQKQS